MSLSSIQLDAFLEVAKTGSFSLAAKNLHVTQSALSQRILNLEEEFASRLFIRDPAGIRLTPGGEELLRYCVSRQRLEQDVVAKIAAGSRDAVGAIKIAGFSSVVRSLVIPALRQYVTENPDARLEISSREMRDLHSMLTRGDVDFVLTSIPGARQGMDSLLIGHETLVMVEAASGAARESVYFDHDVEDQTTIDFFNFQKHKIPRNFRREYLDEIYAIMDAVAAGLGRAVIPRHLMKQYSGLKVVKGFKSQAVPVYLQYFTGAFPSKIHEDVIRLIGGKAKKVLGMF